MQTPADTFDDFTTDELRVRLADAEKARHYRQGVVYAMLHVLALRTEIKRREEAASTDFRTGLEALIAETAPAMVPQQAQLQQADAGAMQAADVEAPWADEAIQDGGVSIRSVRNPCWPLAKVYKRHNAAAIGRLMAMAPDMAAALTEIVASCDAYEETESEEAIERCNAAIRAARVLLTKAAA